MRPSALAENISTVPVMQAEAYVIAGEVFQRQNRLLEAIGAFENAIAIHPDHVRANRWLGAVYYDTGSMRLATKHLRKTSELDPSDVNSLLLSPRSTTNTSSKRSCNRLSKCAAGAN